MQFYEKLSELMEQQEVRSKDMYPRLGMNKSRFSKIKNGTLLPESLLMVRKMAEIMCLNPDECKKFIDTWINSKYGGKFEETTMLIQRLYLISAPNRAFVSPQSIKLENGILLTGNSQIKSSVIQMLYHRTDTIMMDFIPEREAISEHIREILSVLPEHTMIKWLLRLDNRCSNSTMNLRLLINAIPVMLQQKTMIRSSYQHLEEHQETLFPCILITSQEVILFNRNMDRALYLNNPDIQQQYMAHFEKEFNKARKNFQVFWSISEILERGTAVFDSTLPESQTLYIISKYPCIINHIPAGEIKAHISADFKDCDKMLWQFITFLTEYQHFVTAEYSLFWEEGLRELLNSEEYYMYPKRICKSLPKNIRIETMRSMLNTLKQKSKMNAGVISMPFHEETIVHAVNIFSDGKCMILFNIHEELKLIVFEENGIVKNIVEYINTLKEAGIISNTQDTIQKIETQFEKMKIFK